MFVIDEYTRWSALTEKEVQDLNYRFGSALHHHKHPVAKQYHKWGQRTKSKYREDFGKRAASKHPHMAKFKEVWNTFQVLNVAASLKDMP